jgi:predicted DNA-binding transcriptional regulator YafY
MGKPNFGGLESMVHLITKLLDGQTLTAAAIAKMLGIKRAAATQRLGMLAAIPEIVEVGRRPRAIKLAMVTPRQPVDGNTVAAVCLVSSLASALRETSMSEPVSRLREEILTRSRCDYSTEDLGRKFWFVVRGGEKALPEGTVRLADIVEALLASKELTFDYVHFDGRRESGLRAQPLTLALHEHQFYVICRLRGAEPHPYRFARMRNVRLGRKLDYPHSGEYDPRQLFQNVFGIFVGQAAAPIENVKLRFARHWSSYVESHRWHDSQVDRRQADGTTEVAMRVRVCFELERWIVGFGPDVEVLGPASLRARIAQRLSSGAALYSGPPPHGPATAKVARPVLMGPKRRAPAHATSERARATRRTKSGAARR